MSVDLDWKQIAVRLSLTIIAGLIIGFNRSEHGRPAGMRTTLLVCLAASLSMIQVNLLLNIRGRTSDSFIMMDLMRLPLGILSGMGFIGAGTILRRGNLVLGITTAATLWFTTVMGLCFGGGQIGLGLVALAMGWGILWGLEYVEALLRQDCRGTLTVVTTKAGPSDQEIRQDIIRSGCVIISWAVAYSDHGKRRKVQSEVQWRAVPRDTQPPAFVARLLQHPTVEKLKWAPQGTPGGSGVQQNQPAGTPVAISARED